MSKLLLFGLGNPGSRYEWTPHNIGFQVLDAVAAKRRADWSDSKRRYLIAECNIRSTRITLVKPTTYVNLSGEALRAALKEKGFEVEELLVVVDDIALPFGQLRLRKSGTDGGHNGLKSIIDELNTTRFLRLRMGVGPVPQGEDAAGFVTGRFSSDREPDVLAFVDRAVNCVYDILARGIDRAMSLHNAAESESD